MVPAITFDEPLHEMENVFYLEPKRIFYFNCSAKSFRLGCKSAGPYLQILWLFQVLSKTKSRGCYGQAGPNKWTSFISFVFLCMVLMYQPTVNISSFFLCFTSKMFSFKHSMFSFSNFSFSQYSSLSYLCPWLQVWYS